MLRFTLFGFPVEIQWPFWLITALLGGASSAHSATAMHALLIWVAIVFVSILLHELGHALAMRYFGDGRVRIVLGSFGGYAQGSRWLARTEDIVISAAGPATSMLIGTLGWALAVVLPPRSLLPAIAYHDWLQVNIFWALVNLLPIVPLDGGRISLALFGPRRELNAYRLSLGFAVGIAALGFYMGSLFLGLMFGMMAWNNWQRLNNRSEVDFRG